MKHTIASQMQESALDNIMQWDYEATGDFAPWDYDDEAAKYANSREDVTAFVIETGWKGAAKDNAQAFDAAFQAWHAGK